MVFAGKATTVSVTDSLILFAARVHANHSKSKSRDQILTSTVKKRVKSIIDSQLI